jgi:hypothetical protein
MTLLFPFSPDWKSSYKITREFKTDIITSRSGKEQRRAVRNRPRKKVEFGVLEFAARARLFATAMRQQIGSSIYMADYSRSVTATEALVPGATTMGVSATPPWLTGAVVLASGAQMEVRQVELAVAGVITFSDTSANDWGEGTIIYPALLGRLAMDTQGTRPTDDAVQISVAFDVLPGSEPEIDPGAAPLTFNGREVFLAKPDWGTTVSVSFRHAFETVDYGQGLIDFYEPVAYAARAHQATYLEMDATSMSAIEDIFYRAKGQRGEFYMPTWSNDLIPNSLTSAGGYSFTVAGLDVANAYAVDTVYKALAIFYADGSQQFIRVQQVYASGENTIVQCTGSVFAQDINIGNVKMICWLPVCRFASDGMTTEWITNTVAQSQLNVVTLEDLTPET